MSPKTTVHESRFEDNFYTATSLCNYRGVMIEEVLCPAAGPSYSVNLVLRSGIKEEEKRGTFLLYGCVSSPVARWCSLQMRMRKKCIYRVDFVYVLRPETEARHGGKVKGQRVRGPGHG